MPASSFVLLPLVGVSSTCVPGLTEKSAVALVDTSPSVERVAVPFIKGPPSSF
jgi:hypothetical protein